MAEARPFWLRGAALTRPSLVKLGWAGWKKDVKCPPLTPPASGRGIRKGPLLASPARGRGTGCSLFLVTPDLIRGPFPGWRGGLQERGFVALSRFGRELRVFGQLDPGSSRE